MNSFRILIIIALTLFGGCFIGCSQKKEAAPIVTGQVIDTVWCDKNPTQSYSLYLPKKFHAEFKMPVVFFYDPGARGRFPVSLYSSLAEKYQCMLVCSNNSKNGPFNVTQDAEHAILQDVTSKFPIANDKLFVSGFSGGARSAVYLAQSKKIYAGIIACGAAFPSGGKLMSSENIPFIELVGVEDLNMTEAFQAEEYLEQIKYPHSLILFQGGHQWPPLDVFDQALFWQLSKSANAGKYIVSDSLTEMHETNICLKLKQELDSGDVYMAYLNVVQARLFASQSVKIDSIKKSIEGNPLKEKQQKEFPILFSQESALQEKFYSNLFQLKRSASDTAFNETTWKKFISSVKKLSQSDDRQEAHMGERVFSYMRIVCFEEYKGQWDAQDYLHASLTMRVSTLVNNDNWTYYLLARTYAARSMKREAIQALAKSADLGFSNKSLLGKEGKFSFLANEKKFKEVLLQIESNAKKLKP